METTVLEYDSIIKNCKDIFANKMKDYAYSMDIDLSNWEFLTGSENEIYDIVKSGFSLAVGQDDLAPGGIFHSSSLTIVDQYGYIRTGLDKKRNIKFVCYFSPS